MKDDTTLHLYAGVGTFVATLAMIGGGVASGWGGGGRSEPEDPFKDMVVIDAALAEVSKAPDKQPQKKFRAPPPPDKPTGVATDDQAKPVDPTKPEPKKSEAPPDLKDFMRDDEEEPDDDTPVGKPTRIERGVIGGSEVGFGDKTFGDPYLGELKSTFLRGWEYPEILDDVGVPIGCIRIKEDGSIEDTKLMQPSGNADLDTSVEQALAAFQKKVNQNPKPLPSNLTDLTRMPLCWRMKV